MRLANALGYASLAGAVVLGLMCMAKVWVVLAMPVTHNAAGGYIDACGELPGLVGDDC